MNTCSLALEENLAKGPEQIIKYNFEFQRPYRGYLDRLINRQLELE